LADILDKHNLLEIFNFNSINVQTEILKLLKTIPSKSDKVGWIYGFCLDKDKPNQFKNDFWMKIGRTERNDPYIRVDEWGGNLIFCFKSSFNHRLERLCHLFFSYAREKRYNVCDQKYITRPLCSKININCLCFVWSCWLRPNDTYLECATSASEIEWFHFVNHTNVLNIVTCIVNLVEDIYVNNCMCTISPIIENMPTCVEKININMASKEALMVLKGVGSTNAEKIIQFRSNTKFNSIEDILKIKGMTKIYGNNKENICV
jgi:competence ComEA-like helix-hairpin-helix protein